MTLNEHIAACQALVAEDAANGELVVLACNGRSELEQCLPRLEQVEKVWDNPDQYDFVSQVTKYNAIIIE